MDTKEETKPWKGICCETCWFAKGKRCICKCGGKYHGVGLKTTKEEEDNASQQD